jgi:hypothetical protein
LLRPANRQNTGQTRSAGSLEKSGVDRAIKEKSLLAAQDLAQSVHVGSILMLLVKLEPTLLFFGRWFAFKGPSNIATAIERSLSIERPKLKGLFYRQPRKAATDRIRTV